MRFATRAFLFSFVPFAILLAGSFWAIQHRVQDTVREGLRSSLREAHGSMARLRAQSELQNSRFLRIVAENPPLKAGLQVMLSNPKSGEARLTVEDQLRDIAETLNFDFLLISGPNGAPLAGVMRIDDELVAMDVGRVKPPQQGFFTLGSSTYQLNSFPIDVDEENIGSLSIGEHFDLAAFSTPTVLAHNGEVLRTSIPHTTPAEVQVALGKCGGEAECETSLGDETYLTLSSDTIQFGNGYTLRTLQSVDSVSSPVQRVLRRVFLVAALGALLAAAFLSYFSSYSIVKPIAAVVSRLHEGESTGILPAFEKNPGTIQEIRELTDAFNRAATAVREGRENLQQAYVEFVGSLASSLDARDDYTAGHSHRVSDYACILAKAMGVEGEALETIRVGALLHDIGKIGVLDSVLRKPGKLTTEEFALLRQHPSIGRRILEGVRGFQPYLPIVELHHENWDGTGYPLQLADIKVPLCARIVHVADAYDAMTSARPYRSALSHDVAVHELERFAGTQFDPQVVAVIVASEEIRQMSHPVPDAAARPRVVSFRGSDHATERKIV